MRNHLWAQGGPEKEGSQYCLGLAILGGGGGGGGRGVPVAQVLPASYQQEIDGPSFCQANAETSALPASFSVSL